MADYTHTHTHTLVSQCVCVNYAEKQAVNDVTLKGLRGADILPTGFQGQDIYCNRTAPVLSKLIHTFVPFPIDCECVG